MSAPYSGYRINAAFRNRNSHYKIGRLRGYQMTRLECDLIWRGWHVF